MNLERKRTSELLLSARSRQQNFSIRSLSSSCSRCTFCNSQITPKAYFPLMINKALYTKYSSSQNYYYTRGLNDFLTNSRTESVIRFKDNLHFEEEEEYLKRFYKQSEYEGKITMLTEYYKFHRDIARTFMLPATSIVNHYHDKKRRLEYFRVTKMLREQNQERGSSSAPEVVKMEKKKAMPITNRVLDDLEVTDAEIRGANKRNLTEEIGKGKGDTQKLGNKENQIVDDLKKKAIQESKVSKVGKKKTERAIKKEEDKEADQAKNLSGSQTIQELNWKLGEIISTSYSQNYTDMISHFESNEMQDNISTNLDNFLEYIQSNNDASKLNKIPAIFSSCQQIENNSSLHNVNHSTNSTSNQLSLRTDSRGCAQSIQLKNQNHMYQGKNLADAVLRRVSLDQPKNLYKRMVSTDHHDEEQPFTVLASSRVLPNQAVSIAKPKTKRPASIKIQNFEEALRFRQPTSPQLTSQNSISREGSHSKFPTSLSQRTQDFKSVKSNQLHKIREVMTTRRESYTNSNLLKSSAKPTKKLKTSLHVTVERPTEIHSSRTNYPVSQKEIRASLDMHPISRHMSQPAGINQALVANLNFATENNNRFGSRGEVESGKSFCQKNKMNRGKPSIEIVSKGRGKYPSTLTQFELPDKDIKIVPATASLRPVVQSEFTSRNGYKSFHRASSNFEPEAFNLKEKSSTRKALTHRETNITGHKYNKSEVKLERFEFVNALGKKGSLPQSLTSRDAEQIFYNEGRNNIKKEHSPSRSIHTYNYNNIVNVIIQPNVRSNKENDFRREDLQKLGFKQNIEREMVSDFYSSGDFGRKDKELMRTRKSDIYNLPHNVEYIKSSPNGKKGESKSGKIKNKYRSSLNAAIVTYSKTTSPMQNKGNVEVDLVAKRVTVNDSNNYKTLLKFKRK